MDVFEAVRTVLAVRQFKDTPIPEATRRRILESAWLTASSKNGQPWHFVVVEDRPTLQKLGSMIRTGPYIPQAAFAVVVGIDDTVYAVSDASRAIQSMVLTAWSEGVGSNWTGWRGMNQVNPLVGLPAEVEVIAVVPFGYPAKRIGKGRKNRKPFGEVVSRGKFGVPYG